MSNLREYIRPVNVKGQAHGFWKIYWDSGNLNYKCYFVNNIPDGYCEYYGQSIRLEDKSFFLK